MCSAAVALVEIVRSLAADDELTDTVEECSGLREAMEDAGTRRYGLACLRMASLVAWLERRQRSGERAGDIPGFFEEPLRSLIVSVARQPLVNSFVLTPPLLWKHGWTSAGTGPTK